MRENLFSMKIDSQDLEILNNNFRQLFKRIEKLEERVNYLENDLKEGFEIPSCQGSNYMICGE